MKKIFILLWLVFMISWCGNATNKENIESKNIESVEKIQILALWDSITAWYRLPLQDSYPFQLEKLLWPDKYEVTNAWVSGDTSQQTPW